ncbi:MAG: hypothetical protein OXH09_22590 [Gammaproteobacteria bacterium]|nr:hypothetical protein [Gammaproteobacteria bacterium]
MRLATRYRFPLAEVRLGILLGHHGVGILGGLVVLLLRKAPTCCISQVVSTLTRLIRIHHVVATACLRRAIFLSAGVSYVPGSILQHIEHDPSLAQRIVERVL